MDIACLAERLLASQVENSVFGAPANSGGEARRPTLLLPFNPKRGLTFLIASVGMVVFGGITSAILAIVLRIDPTVETGGGFFRIIQLLHLDTELSIPAYFSSLLLLAAGFLLWLISLEHCGTPSLRWKWSFLALGFVWLAFDEAASIHEILNPIARSHLGLEGLLGAAWTVPALVLIAILAVAYLPFLRSLPKRYLCLFLVAATLYLGGAIGVEAVGIGFKEDLGPLSWRYQIEVVIEESCEMMGIVVFIYALTSYLAEHGSIVWLQFDTSGESRPTR